MPKLWEGTIQAHRDAVREAVIETTWRLVRERGLRSVTMSQIAVSAGIGRATLYKYFPDVESILLAGHTQHVSAHLEQLGDVRSRPGTPGERLRAGLLELARICLERARHGTPELAALLHQPDGIGKAEEHLNALIAGLVSDAAEAGDVRRDVPATELASYCVHALAAAASTDDVAAHERLVEVCLRGMFPSR